MASIIVGVRYGMGKHQDHQTPSEAVKIIQVGSIPSRLRVNCVLIIFDRWSTRLPCLSFFVSGTPRPIPTKFFRYLTVCRSLKMSILCLYLRMTPEKKHRRAIYGITVFVCLYATATLFVSIPSQSFPWLLLTTGSQANMFECTPISDFWNIEDIFNNQWGCVNIILMDIFTNSWSAFEDVVIWLLPIPILWNLKVPSAKKCSSHFSFQRTDPPNLFLTSNQPPSLGSTHVVNPTNETV